MSIVVVIPAYNEENGVGKVIGDIPVGLVKEIVVVDNASTDTTAKVAKNAGATVLREKKRGYGSACLKGIDYLKNKRSPPEIVVFLDADYSDYPEDMSRLVEPIINGNADLVIGSRNLGNRKKGSMTLQQIFGNWLATFLIRILYKVRFSDLGPFRAIRYNILIALDMQDKTYGWTTEMQLKAAKSGVSCLEVPVNYRPRIGHSKISGTVKGTIMAGYKIITTIFKYL